MFYPCKPMFSKGNPGFSVNPCFFWTRVLPVYDPCFTRVNPCKKARVWGFENSRKNACFWAGFCDLGLDQPAIIRIITLLRRLSAWPDRLANWSLGTHGQNGEFENISESVFFMIFVGRRSIFIYLDSSNISPNCQMQQKLLRKQKYVLQPAIWAFYQVFSDTLAQCPSLPRLGRALPICGAVRPWKSAWNMCKMLAIHPKMKKPNFSRKWRIEPKKTRNYTCNMLISNTLFESKSLPFSFEPGKSSIQLEALDLELAKVEDQTVPTSQLVRILDPLLFQRMVDSKHAQALPPPVSEQETQPVHTSGRMEHGIRKPCFLPIVES